MSAPGGEAGAAEKPNPRAAAEKALTEWKAPDLEKKAEREKLRGASSGLVLGRWNQAIDKAAMNQDPETAERLIMQIREAGLTPDTVSYNSVMHACARAGDPRRVEHWYLEMRRESGIAELVVAQNTAKCERNRHGEPGRSEAMT